MNAIDSSQLNIISLLQDVYHLLDLEKDKESIFRFLLDKVMLQTNSKFGMICQVVHKPENDNYFKIVANSLPDEQMTSEMSKYYNQDGHSGYCIHATRNLFGKIMQTKRYIINNNMQSYLKERQTCPQFPKGHPDLEKCLIFPIVRSGIVKLCIVLCNNPENYTSKHVNILKSLTSLIGILSETCDVQSLNKIYSRVVDSIDLPLIICRNQCSQIAQDVEEYCIQDLYIFIVNESMLHFVKKPEHWFINTKLVECFPIFETCSEMNAAILNCLKTQNSHSIKTIEIKDLWIQKDNYTLQFVPIDEDTCLITIQPLSEMARAEQMVKDASKTKKEFVANVSHEIRTPLNGIIGMTGLLIETELDQQQEEYVETIKQSGMNLMAIINDILDFSKLEANQIKIRETNMDLRECIETSYDVIKLKAEQKGLDIAYFIDPKVPTWIISDYQRLQQIFINILGNAVKFTDHGRICTSVRLAAPKSSIDDKYTIVFDIMDTGIGINKSDQAKLFKSFSQIDQSNTKMYQGTGLGLVISKELSKLLGGDISVKSKLGKGSVFTIVIRAKEGEIDESLLTVRYENILKGKCVLVVDDNATNRIMLCQTVSRWGMKPIASSSGQEALLYIANNIYDIDLVLVDIQMPIMDGFELATKIKELKPKVPLVALSSIGYSQDDNIFQNYLTKPVKEKKLLGVCIKVLDDATNFKCFNANENLENGSTGTRPTFATKEKNLNILLAEDIYINQKVAISILHKLGFRNIDIVENGFQVLERLDKKGYDVLLLNIKMPKMDGYRTFRRIVKKFKQKRPYVVALTASAMKGDREKCLNAGMDNYVSKPIDINLLASILNQLENKKYSSGLN